MLSIRDSIGASAAAIGKGDLDVMVDNLHSRLPINPVVLEIGLFHCGLTALIYKYLEPSLYVGVDNNSKPEDVPDFPPYFHLLWERDSNDLSTELAVKEYLAGKQVDFLFIDGGHQYNTVLNDYEYYSPLVKDGGIIGFHDIHLNSSGGQVKPLWDRLKTQYQYIEISCNSESTGIGLIFKGEGVKIIS